MFNPEDEWKRFRFGNTSAFADRLNEAEKHAVEHGLLGYCEGHQELYIRKEQTDCSKCTQWNSSPQQAIAL